MAREFIPSPQQQEFFDWVTDPSGGSCVLIAVAGAGKTETLVRSMALMKGSVAAVAFNRKAALELKERASQRGVARNGLFISTAHGAGYSAWRHVYPNARVDENKVRSIIDELVAAGRVDLAELERPIKRLVSLGKQMLAGVKWDIDNVQAWLRLMSYYDVDQDLPDDVDSEVFIAAVQRVFRLSGHQCTEVIDFDDMIWAPIAFNCRLFKNDWVLIDEAQDINLARRELARRMLKPTGRLVAVGDPHQAIYAFTGASSDSMAAIAQEFNCRELGLTVSYRCPQLVVEHAQHWVHHIQAHADAPDGEVRTLEVATATDGKVDPWYQVTKLLPTDAILCRYNAPLISTAYALLKAGIACKVEGRDIGQGLVALARRWKVKKLDALQARLERWLDRELGKARKARSATKEQAAQDKFDTMQVFIERCRAKGADTVDCVVAEIESLFSDNVTGVTVLSSIHRAKGLEWLRVFWMQTATRTRRELKDWEEEAERNLNYVATTRAMHALVLVPEALHS